MTKLLHLHNFYDAFMTVSCHKGPRLTSSHVVYWGFHEPCNRVRTVKIMTHNHRSARSLCFYIQNLFKGALNQFRIWGPKQQNVFISFSLWLNFCETHFAIMFTQRLLPFRMLKYHFQLVVETLAVMLFKWWQQVTGERRGHSFLWHIDNWRRLQQKTGRWCR